VVDELRAFVRRELPDYMVPSALMVLDALPMTPNGKVDRRALPAPDGTRAAGEGFVAPRAGLESTLADIWRDVLRVDRVGVHDNFFDLGGHSLLLTQVHQKVRERVDQNTPMMVLFRFPTIRSLADYLAAGPEEEKASQRGQERAEARRASRGRRRDVRRGGGQDD
jgi:hypothetical protein